MANVFPGYRGLIDLGTVGQIRFADASISAKQTVNIPDLIMGDFDRDAFNYQAIEVGGSVSGPVTETFVASGGPWDWGVKRIGDCGTLNEEDVTVWYYCDGGASGSNRKFNGMLVNTLGFSCAAGDIAQFTMDLMGKSAEPWDTGAALPHFITTEKLLTWDRVTIAITADEEFTPPANIAYSNFDFSIANNLTPVYSLGQANLFPYEIVPGLRTITGTISVYNTPHADGRDTWLSTTSSDFSNLTFNIGTLSVTFHVRWHRVEPASSVTPIISTIGFSGVGSQAQLD